MPKPQSYESHMKWDVLHHMIITPLLLLSVLATIFFWISFGWRFGVLWLFVSLMMLLISSKSRVYSLSLQDRLIGIEERLRLTALLPASEHAAISRLTRRQLIALRFAADEELPALAHRTLNESLDPKQIKRAIQNWRPDHHRV
jgi:hypothetical protein